MLIDDLKERKSFKNKVLSADVFERKKIGAIKKLWQQAKDIEITFDFLQLFKSRV